MSVFVWLSLFSSAFCLALGVNVYVLNRKALVNKLMASALLITAYRAFAEFMMRQASNPETAYLWSKMYFLWPFLAVLVLHFTLAFTGNKLLKNKLTCVFLYVPTLLISIVDLTTDLISVPPFQAYWGYTYTFSSGSLVCIVSNIWVSVLSLLSLVLFIQYYYRVTEKTRKQQTKFMVVGITIPVFVSLLTCNLFPFLGVDFPSLGSISISVFSVFIAYTMWKYELFSLSPAVAAESIISAMPDSLVLADLQGKIIQVNRSLVTFFGYSEDELIGKSIIELCVDDNCGVNLLKALVEKREIRNFETKWKTKTGEEKPVVISGSLVRSKRGQDIGITYIIHDITKRKAIEEKLVRSERFASIGELAGMIGHDLRNPLTSIRAATYYFKIKYGGKLDDEGKEIFGTIDRSIEYSNKIVDDLLEYSREVRLQLEAATPKSMVEDVLSLMQTPTNVGVTNLAEDAPVVKVDVGKMSRVFVNLVKNAFDAMPNGGNLTIKSQVVEGNLEMRFIDTGVGMSKETLDKLWMPLFTTKAKGMGFGLPICKRLIESHGGTISVESTNGQGTTIAITIPVVSTLINGTGNAENGSH